MQGQIEVVSYWYERRAPDRSILEDLYELGATAEDAEQKKLAYDRYVRHPIEGAEAVADRLTDEALASIEGAADDAVQRLAGAKDDLIAKLSSVQETAEESVAISGRPAFWR